MQPSPCSAPHGHPSPMRQCRPCPNSVRDDAIRSSFAHVLDPLSTPGAGLKRLRKVLCFPCNLVAAELHDAHGVGRLPVVRQNILGDPKITAANDPPHSETLFARLIRARELN